MKPLPASTLLFALPVLFLGVMVLLFVISAWLRGGSAQSESGNGSHSPTERWIDEIERMITSE